MSEPIKNRYDFVILFDVENGNPNGDPDAGNMPRVDPETGYGLVTDVCLKRKIRNYVETVKEDAPDADRYRIYVKDGVPLNRSDAEAIQALGISEDLKAAKRSDPDIDRRLRDYMCAHYFDIRTFGAVMTTFVKGALNCGQVRGPVQLSFARSIDPVVPQEVTITRVAITTEADAEKKGTEMGRKHIIPYALYRAEGYVSANLARKTTGFSEEDLDLLWKAILNLFENDHSAARGKMAVRELIVFRHDSELGNAPSYKLFDAVQVQHKPDVIAPAATVITPLRWQKLFRRASPARGCPDGRPGRLPADVRHPAFLLLPPSVGAHPSGTAMGREPAHRRGASGTQPLPRYQTDGAPGRSADRPRHEGGQPPSAAQRGL